MASPISEHTRKRLWTWADDRCAFPDCGARLLHPNEAGDEETIVGQECHIVAQADHPSVARAPSSLGDEEKVRWADLIENRHGFANLVLMCQIHARVIDDPAQNYSVAQVVAMKKAHEEDVRWRRTSRAEAMGAGAATVVHQPLLLEDVGAWQRKATAALARVDSAALVWLRERIGSPAEPGPIAALIEEWPTELRDGPVELANLLVREAEGLAMWPDAATAWERIAAGKDQEQKADLLARAAIDAGVAGEDERRERLLAKSERLDPDGVRARLERVDEDLSPQDQLAYLADLQTDDAPLASLIAARRALAHLQAGDPGKAEIEIERAQELEPDSIAVQIARVNCDLHTARIALASDRPFVVARVLAVFDRAIDLRERLIEMGRWEESGRLLMMASDARSLLRDQGGAQEVLERALPEEVRAARGAAVLGDAALRAGAPQLALGFVEGLESDPGLRRIAASACADLGGPGRALALTELEELAQGEGEEAEAAAVARLVLCLPPVLAPWSDGSAKVLEDGQYDRYVRSLRVMSLAVRDPAAALKLADSLPEEAWGAEVRLRIAGIADDDSKMAAAAKEFLGHSPDGMGRLIAAQAFGRIGEFERAGEIALAVARDPNTPPIVRSDGFHIAMKSLADRDLWSTASQTWDEWRDMWVAELPRFDGRISAWQVRVLHNRPH
jgi:hypothetical protein